MKRALFFVIAAIAAAITIVVACKSPPTSRPKFGAVAPASTFASVPTGPNGAGYCPLGWYQKDPNTSTCSTAFGWTPAYSDAATTVFAIQNLAPSDFDFVTVFVHAQVPGAVDFTGEAWWRIKWGLKYPVDAGAFADPTGVEAGTAVDSQVGSQLTGCAPTLVQAGGQLGIQMLCGVAVAVEGNVDWDRSSLAPWVLSVSPAHSWSTLTSSLQVTITTTPGAAQYASGATLAGYILSQCSQANDHQATCTLTNGSYASVTGDVCLSSASSPFCAKGIFSFDAGDGAANPGPIIAPLPSPILQSASGGGPNITVTCASGCAGATSAHVGATAATIVSSTPTSFTFTPPAVSSTTSPTYSLTVTTPNGTSPAINNAIGALSAGFSTCVYAPQGYTVGGPWVDFVGGISCVSVGATSPGFTASWANGNPAVNSSTATVGLKCPFTTISQPYAIYGTESFTNTGSNQPASFAAGTTSVPVIQVAGSPFNQIELFAISAIVSSNAMPGIPAGSTPFSVAAIFNGASSSMDLNGTSTTGSPGGSALGGGLTIFSNEGSYTFGIIGNIGLACVFNGVPAAGDTASYGGNAAAIFGTPSL